MEAFSDGVFAIAITLLILDIKVPRVDSVTGTPALREALRHQLPAFLAYILSFVTIGIIWANHITMFRHVRRTNHILLMLNTLFLLCIAFLPFATSILAEYIQESHDEQQIVVLIYGGTLFAMAICFNVIWWYGTHHHGLLEHNTSPRIVTAITGSYQIGFVTYLSTLILAWFWPLAALAVYALLALYYALPGPGKEA